MNEAMRLSDERDLDLDFLDHLIKECWTVSTLAYGRFFSSRTHNYYTRNNRCLVPIMIYGSTRK